MKLIKDLSEIFSEYLPSDLKFDIACRAICRDFKASSATILIYQGKEEILKCTGRYIDPLSAVENYNNNTEIESVLKQIGYLELMDLRERKILDDSLLEKYRNNPLYNPQGKLKNEEKLEWNAIRRKYQKYKELLKFEKYDLKTEESPTISYYKDLFLNKDIDEKIRENIKILLLKKDNEHSSRYYCIKWLEEKFKISLYLGYYIAIPLYSKGRIFGVLRIMFSSDSALISTYQDSYVISPEFQIKLNSVGALLSSLVDFDLFISGYKRALISTDVDISDKNMDEILSDHCEMLSEIIQSRGAILRHYDDNKQRWLIRGSTGNLCEYKKYMNEEYTGADFFIEFDNKFTSNQDIFAVSFSIADNDIKSDSNISMYLYNSNIIKTTKDIWDLQSIFPKDVLSMLRSLKIDKAFIFRLKDFEQSYIVFFNTPTKDFSAAEADLIYPSINNLSIQLQKYDRSKIIRERQKILDDFYSKVKKIVGEEQPSNRDYVRIFLKHISEAIEQFKIFKHYFLWQYLSEDIFSDELNNKKVTRKYALRCLSKSETESNAIYKTGAKIRPEKQDYFPLDEAALIKLSKSMHELQLSKETIISLELKDEWRQLDLPFFDEHSTDGTIGKPVGVLTLIYNKSNEWIEKDESFFIFLESCSRHIGIAWDKFQEMVAEEIEEKINEKIENKQFIADSSRKSRELKEISGVIADYFDCELCCFFLSDDKSLWLTASNIDISRNLAFDLNKDKDSIFVKTYLEGKNFRLLGNSAVLEHIDGSLIDVINDEIKKDLLSILSEKYNNRPFKEIRVEHCISQVIRIGHEKKLGLIVLFRIQGLESNDSGKIINKPPPAPFSQFESSLFDRIRKHIYNIIFTGRNFKQRMDDLQNVIHQVNSPLTAMQQFAKNIQQKIYPPEKIDEKLKFLSALSRTSFYFAQNYQRLFDLEKGGIKLAKKLYNLKSYLISLAIDYQPMARAERGISVHVLESMPEDIDVEIDRLFFDHVIKNLLHNAVKYSYNATERFNAGLKQFPDISTYDKENIYISAYVKLNKVTIKISSWGLPMSAEERKKIFSRQFRGQKAIDKNPVGTGIGCWIASEIVKLHGGKLELEDYEMDDRFVFKIELQKGNQ